MRTFATAIALLVATLACAQDSGMRVLLLSVQSMPELERWLQQQPEQPFPGRLRELPLGKPVHFPILVSGLRPPAQGEVRIVADVDIAAPDGKSMGSFKQCCSFTITNRPDVRTVLLGPTVNVAMDPQDKKGDYTVRVSVTDGVQRVDTSGTFRFAGAPDSAPSRRESGVPMLQMGEPPARNPGKDLDKRDCLKLATPAEVIKCTERR